MGLNKPYQYGSYNKYDDNEQWIRITEGCPNGCEYCYEPKEFKIHPIPEIVRNKVKIMDMNLLAKPESSLIIGELGNKRVNGKVVNYELICGIDWRFLTPAKAMLLKTRRFKNIRIGWDGSLQLQYKIKDSIELLLENGYKSKELMIFMICNWKVKYDICCQKLDLLKIWRVKVADCYFDGQVSPNIEPIYWTKPEIKQFRKQCRKHNQLVIFGINPELPINEQLELEPQGKG